jgi:hypothetical protein
MSSEPEGSASTETEAAVTSPVRREIALTEDIHPEKSVKFERIGEFYPDDFVKYEREAGGFVGQPVGGEADAKRVSLHLALSLS